MAHGKKLSFSLLVLQASDLKRLPEGSLSNIALAGCEESATILLALSRLRAAASDSMEGRGQPTTFSAVRTTLCSALTDLSCIRLVNLIGNISFAHLLEPLPTLT